MTVTARSPEARGHGVFGSGPRPAARPLQRLFEAAPEAMSPVQRRLGAALRHVYDGDLVIPLRSDRPTLIANFVETLDGAVALAPGTRSGGGDVSGHDPVDRFVMSLLRALSDVVLVGAGTVRASKGTGWAADGADAEASADLAALRQELGLAPQPTTLIATQRGELDPALPVFRQPHTPMVIAGPDQAVQRLHTAGFSTHIRIVTLGSDPTRSATALMDIARGLGARLVLSEAGPHLTAQFVAAGLLDELFLTLSPRLVGRDPATPRLAMLEGVALWPATASVGKLISVRRAGDTMFLRYRLKEDDRE